MTALPPHVEEKLAHSLKATSMQSARANVKRLYSLTFTDDEETRDVRKWKVITSTHLERLLSHPSLVAHALQGHNNQRSLFGYLLMVLRAGGYEEHDGFKWLERHYQSIKDTVFTTMSKRDAENLKQLCLPQDANAPPSSSTALTLSNTLAQVPSPTLQVPVAANSWKYVLMRAND